MQTCMRNGVTEFTLWVLLFGSCWILSASRSIQSGLTHAGICCFMCAFSYISSRNSHALVINMIDRHLLDVSSHTNLLKLFPLCLKYAIILLCLAVYISWHHQFSYIQEAQLSPRDRAMRRVNWNLANCHATVQKLLIWQVLTKSMVWSWRFSRRQCVIDNVHSTMMRPRRLPLSQVS